MSDETLLTEVTKIGPDGVERVVGIFDTPEKAAQWAAAQALAELEAMDDEPSPATRQG